MQRDPVNWPPRVIFNSDGNWLFRYAVERNAADLTILMPVLAASGMDAFSILIGIDGCPAWLDSEVAEPWGESCPDWDPDRDPDAPAVGGASMGKIALINKTLHDIVDDGHDLMQLYIDSARAEGVAIFASFRLNDAHVSYEANGWYGRSKERLENAHLLIGPDLPDHTHGHEWLFSWQWDWAQPEVRDHSLSLIDETLTRYDFDGVELDFCRQPPYFKSGEAFDHIDELTDFMRRARRLVDEHGKKDRAVKLLVRVPPCMREAHAIGIDTLTWISEGLMDIAILGSVSLTVPRVDTAAAVEASAGRILIYTGLEGATRRASPQDGFETHLPAINRAVADNGYRQGATGVHMFNNDIPGHQTRLRIGEPPEEAVEDEREVDMPKVNRQLLRDLGDRGALARRNRCYNAQDACFGNYPPHYTHGDPRPQVPRKLALMGRGANAHLAMQLLIEDDVAAGLAEGRIRETELRLQLVDYEQALDRIICTVNGEPVELDTERTVSNRFGDEWLIVADPPVQQGENTIFMALEGIATPDPWPQVKRCEIILRCEEDG